MKSISILLVASIGLFGACRKDKGKPVAYMSAATITGQDLTMTPCSGGYLIKIDNAAAAIRFYKLPAGSTIDLATSTFPLQVKLNWHVLSGDPPSPCGVIVVDAIAKAE